MGGTAPRFGQQSPHFAAFRFRDGGGAQDLLRDVSREHPKKILQPNSVSTPDKQVKMIATNGLAINSNSESAREFFADMIYQGTMFK